MDPDISIWRKTGHFYFALTRVGKNCRQELSQCGEMRSMTRGTLHTGVSNCTDWPVKTSP
jgi:hypothetical protein